MTPDELQSKFERCFVEIIPVVDEGRYEQAAGWVESFHEQHRTDDVDGYLQNATWSARGPEEGNRDYQERSGSCTGKCA